MTKKTTNSYIFTPNFDQKKRKISQIKFLIFHYTGMISEKKAIKKLCTHNTKVSCHYFIKRSGNIIKMLPELYVAWHAGKSNWKNFSNLNKYSIGIEIHNPGHQYGYETFSSKQLNSIVYISKKIIKNFKIENKFILGHSDIAPDRKKDPGEKFPWHYLQKNKIGIWHNLNNFCQNRKISKIYKEKNNSIKLLRKIGYKINSKTNSIKAFQRRFRQEQIDGIADKECVEIIKNIAPYFVQL